MIPDTGIILAGGQSKRMGQDKLFLKIGKETFLEKQYRILNKIFKSVFISVHKKNNQIPYPQIEDKFNAGSLGGIYSSLLFVKKPLFVVAVDMPFITIESVKTIISYYNDNIDIVIPELKRRLEPLFAVYSPECLTQMKELIEKEDFRIINFFHSVKTKIIPQNEFTDIDKKLTFLTNINNPEIYEKLLKGEIN